MTKSELVQRLYRRMHDQWMAEMLKRPKRDRNESPPRLQEAERVVTTIFEEIAEALSRGDRVELRGFGAFSVKDRNPRIGRNPRTGEAVPVEGKRVPYFKTGKELRERLNQD